LTPYKSAYVEIPEHPGCEKFRSAANRLKKLNTSCVQPGSDDMSPDVAIHKLLAQLMTNTTFPNADGDMNTASIRKMIINKNCNNDYME